MSTFPEIIDGTKTDPRRSILWNPALRELTIRGGKGSTTYTVTRFAADGGNGYQLRKLYSTDVYNVFCRRVGSEFYSSCDCAGFTFCRTGARPVCRHLLAMEALEANADLIRTEEPAPAAELALPPVPAMDPDAALAELLRVLAIPTRSFRVPTTWTHNTPRDRAADAAYRM
jgi:hypothetical protein